MTSSPPPPKPVAQFVTDLGGPQIIAEKLRTSPGAVRMWVHRDAVPRPVWPDLIDAFEAVTMDRLKALEPAKSERAA